MLSHALRSLGSSRAEGSDLYIYQLGCSESLKSIVTIGSDDAVRTFDWETLQKQSDQTGLAGLASGLTSMDLWQQGGTNREMVVTGARDGHLNIYDLGRSRESAVGSVQLHEQSILAVTAEQNGNSVMVGCELRGGVARLEAWCVRMLLGVTRLCCPARRLTIDPGMSGAWICHCALTRKSTATTSRL